MKDEIDTPRKRRSFAREFKRQVVEETLVPGASVSGVALRHGLNNNMVFKWRRAYLRRRAPAPTQPVKLLPVSMVADGDCVVTTTAVMPANSFSGIELCVADVQILVHGRVDTEALRAVLCAVRTR
jgi:transposase